MIEMKEIHVECLECSWADDSSDARERYEELLDLEKCPRCGKKIN